MAVRAIESPLSESRMLPTVTDANRAFWTGGLEDELLIKHCASCDRYVHPPRATCPTCSGPLVPRPVSGRGTVFSFTVNHHPYNPGVPLPYVVAIVAIEEQDDVRILTNLVDVDPADVRIEMPVEVVFELHPGLAVPLFRPA